MKLLTAADVCILIENLQLGEYKEEIIANRIDGRCLEVVESVEEIKEWGIKMTTKAKVLLQKLHEFRVVGVPLALIRPTIITGTATAKKKGTKAYNKCFTHLLQYCRF